jgi:hypothetical protein
VWAGDDHGPFHATHPEVRTVHQLVHTEVRAETVITYGWYKERWGKPKLVADFSTGWSGREANENPDSSKGQCLTLRLNRDIDEIKHEHLEIRMTYAEAERIMKDWREYMDAYPEPKGETR